MIQINHKQPRLSTEPAGRGEQRPMVLTAKKKLVIDKSIHLLENGKLNFEF